MSADEVLAKAAEGDPVGQTVPLLAGRKPRAQREMVQWLATLPPERVVFEFPHLTEASELSFATKVQIASESLAQLSAFLDAKIAGEGDAPAAAARKED
jgi:hypothetical protein